MNTADRQDSCTFRDRTSQGRAFVSGDQHLDQPCGITDGQGLTHQTFSALLQRCSVFDAAGSHDGRLDHAIGMRLEGLLCTGADRLEETSFTLGGIQVTDSGSFAFANRLVQAVLNHAEAAACVRLTGIESSEQPHDFLG